MTTKGLRVIELQLHVASITTDYLYRFEVRDNNIFNKCMVAHFYQYLLPANATFLSSKAEAEISKKRSANFASKRNLSPANYLTRTSDSIAIH